MLPASRQWYASGGLGGLCVDVSVVPAEGVVKLGVSILITAGCFKKV